MGSGQAGWEELEEERANAPLIKGWSFTTEGKLVRSEKKKYQYDNSDVGFVGSIYSTKKVAQEKRNDWMRSWVPHLDKQIKEASDELKKLRRTRHRFRTHLRMVDHFGPAKRAAQRIQEGKYVDTTD